MLHQHTVAAKEFLIGPSTRVIETRWKKYLQFTGINIKITSDKKCDVWYDASLLIFYLEGKPAAEIRTVSRMPHARSCCMVLIGSRLNGK